VGSWRGAALLVAALVVGGAVLAYGEEVGRSWAAVVANDANTVLQGGELHEARGYTRPTRMP